MIFVRNILRQTNVPLVVAICLPSLVYAASPAQNVTGDHQYQLGPLTFSVGPQSDGSFGATINGNKSTTFSTLSSLPSSPRVAQDHVQWARYGTLDFSVNAGWSSASNATNNATISLTPSITFDATMVGAPGTKRYAATVTPEEQLKCDKLSDDYGAALDAGKTQEANDLAAQSLRECPTVEDPYRDVAALSLYPTFEYRFGKFTQGGQKYDANQVLIGGGARLFFPWQVGRLLASWPYVSATYYHAKSSSASNIPVPDGIKTDFLQLDANVIVWLPIETSKSGDRLELSIDVAPSKATGGIDRKWEYLTTLQLIANVGGSWKPALTYKKGTQHGFQYDKQLVLGVATRFLGE